ncbi:hypothetical protein A2856_02915 [Candidatus Uhrbacteria bacterium RIFCSPHIGHO2_01_FULL_63_20]|uniref:EamA domain-containing protein n=1 Tax=Candidatus Uhrbacteria bacterium RIFCSPHIGHO2_01_FULL_63_20 TaxID=1802385 RepID=A0A1F7TL41_9BACT|nr:MAG: hypothetical protein A2856_02915 [Candidatus Uhrbacteria bacterium RIFCSPHIGHO2_01_FULL_63_20]
MSVPVLLAVVAQLFFSVGDLLKRLSSGGKEFGPALFKDPAYLAGVVLLPAVGYLVLLYVFTRLELSRTIPILGMSAVILSVALGALVLKEQVSGWNLAGVALAVVAIYLVQLR